VRLPLEAGKVAELARALRAEPGSLPPSYTVLAAHHTPPGRSPNEVVIAEADLDASRVLLGSMEWTHHREPSLGSVLDGTVRLVSTETKESRSAGTLRIAVGTVEWRDADGPVVEVQSTLLEPGRTPEPAAATSDQPMQDGSEQLTLTRTDIVRYAGASGDFNPVHHDREAALALGYPDVFAMGLLPGGILAARLVPPGGLAGARVSISFRGIVWPGTPYAVQVGSNRAALTTADGRTLVEVTR
jgi:hypothetical protein